MEVRYLLSYVMLEMSGCKSENSTPRRPSQVVIPTPPPQKSEELLQPVDTSSQARAEVVEASLEGIPTSIFPIAVVSRARSVIPLVDAMELWANANKVLKDLLTTKASIDACRQRAIWELGVELCQNESQVAESIKEAKAVCSRVTLDAQTTCSQLTLDAMTNCSQAILDAKTTCSAVIKEAKTTWGHIIKEAKATCFSAVRYIKAQRAFQAKTLQREHGNIMWDLETQVIQEEGRSEADFLSTCQATLYISPPEFKSALAASYHLLLEQTPPSPPFILLQRASPVEEQPISAFLPTPVPKQSPRPKR